MREIFANPWVRLALVLVGLLALVALGLLLRPVLVPLFFAFVVAYIFDPVVCAAQRRGLGRQWATAVVLTIVTIGVLSLPLLMLPGIIREASQFGQAASQIEPGWLERGLERLPVEEWLVAAGWVEEGTEDINARAVIAQRLGQMVRENARALWTASGRAGSSLASFIGGVSQGVAGIVGFLANLALFAFVAIYLLLDFDAITRGMRELVPPRWRPPVFRIAGKVDHNLQSFLRGQLLVCLILATMYGVGLWLSGTPFAITIAVISGAASVVPFVGPALMLLLSSATTLLDYGLSWNILGVLATWAIAQGLEGNFITPRVLGQQIGLHPVWVLLAAVTFGWAFGFVGVLLAVPTAAVLKVFVEEVLDWYRGSAFFNDDETPGWAARPDTEAAQAPDK